MQSLTAPLASWISSNVSFSIPHPLPNHAPIRVQDLSPLYLIGIATGVAAALKALVSTVGIFIKVAFRLGTYAVPSRIGRYAHQSSTGQPPWALITGTTQGIGKCLADEFATRGFNVVLHGRNEEKLFDVMTDMQKRHPQRSFRILVADASAVPCSNCQQEPSSSAIDFDAIKKSLKDIHLTVLVNNAGSGPSNPIYASLGDCSQPRLQDNISLNGLFPIHMARTLIPQLIQNSPSLILNVSSFSDQGFPWLVSYSASKQFMLNWTKAVGLEMRMDGHDVEMLAVRIAKTTDTSFSQSDASLFMPKATTMAKAIIQKIGWKHGIVTAYWAHAIQESILSILPWYAKDQLFMSVIRGEKAAELQNKKKQ